MPANGMFVIAPSGSPAVVASGAGSSATVGTNGKVTFSACTSLSLNNIFSSAYDNYMIIVSGTSSDDGGNIAARLRTGTSDASATNYAYEVLAASSSTITGVRVTGATYGRFVLQDNESTGAGLCYIFGPYLAQPTVWRSHSVGGGTSVFIRDFTATHSLSTSYESITIFNETSGQTISGIVTVYGLNQ